VSPIPEVDRRHRRISDDEGQHGDPLARGRQVPSHPTHLCLSGSGSVPGPRRPQPTPALEYEQPLSNLFERALNLRFVGQAAVVVAVTADRKAMRNEELALYETPSLYDAFFPPGPCESFYRSLAERTGGPVLELACGTGRLSVPLAKDGHELVGIDTSAAMLRTARRKAEAAGLTIEFVEQDMRSFELSRAFPLVFVSCNSLCHLTTNEELTGVLRRIARHLAPGGLLAFDIVNPHVADLARVDAVSVRLNVLRGRDPVTATEEVLAYDAVAQVRVMQWQITGAPDGSRRTEEMRLRIIFPQELPLLLCGRRTGALGTVWRFRWQPADRGRA
jgi:SAM-dependent methyltransferase